MKTPQQAFHSLFFSNVSCQNLFLLSKYQLLETLHLGTTEIPYQPKSRRFIISNASTNDLATIEDIRLRSEAYRVRLDLHLQQTIANLQPVIEDYFNSQFKKSLAAYFADFKKNTSKHISTLISIFTTENHEKILLDYLKEYHFIGNHIECLSTVELNIQRVFTPSKNNTLINYESLQNLKESIQYMKALYLNYAYGSLYSTDQVLNTSLGTENLFEKRLQLYGLLFDSKIIEPSSDDSFVECFYCPPDTYRGVFQLQLNPTVLRNLKCPVCQNALTYFVPYALQSEIFQIVNAPDGVLLHALSVLLQKNAIPFKLNEKYSNDIEIDCVFWIGSNCYLVESKMYKLTNDYAIISKKIKAHFEKLHTKVDRIQAENLALDFSIIPVLITNVPDELFLDDQKKFFTQHSAHSNRYQNSLLLNLKSFISFHDFKIPD